MALDKNGYNIPFGQGLDLKTDPNQVAAGKMLALQNITFASGQLQKRAGFADLSLLPPGTNSTTLSTLNGTLLTTGSNLYAYSSETNQWLNRGLVQPVSLTVSPLVRNSTSQSAADTAVAPSGISCTVYKDASGSYYQINDALTGQIIVNQTSLPSTATMARAFVLGSHFVITYLRTVSATPHLQYIAIPLNNPTNPGSALDLSTSVSGLTAGYDGVVANNSLYVAWNGSDGGGAIRITYLSSTLTQGTTVIIAGKTADLLSITADNSSSTPVIWVSIWDTTSNNGWAFARTPMLVQVLAPVQIITGLELTELTSVATAGVLYFYYQETNTYSFSSVRTDLVHKNTITQAGSVGSASIMLRGVGLASKAFYYNSTKYMMLAFQSAFQPTYFLSDSDGNVIMKLAYSNGGGYQTNQILPSASINDDIVSIAYLLKDLLVSVNKSVDANAPGGIYSQTGVNLAKFSINIDGQLNSEIANSLQLTGGFVWQYDAVKPVEHGFHLWPEDLKVTTATTGGSITDQEYFYAFTYEWTDAQGMLQRSAPSVATSITTAGGNTSTNTIKVPTLRITYKVSPNFVRIVGYRWSTAQQVFYQFTSITNPTLNSTTVDSVTITDTLADSSILGNSILYTTGGVLENIAAPANVGSTLYRSRQWIIDAEDPNLLWFSKQVLSGTPVEFSDLLTLYVSPSAITQGAATGPCTVLSAMDDKLIIFKKNAIYYVTGNGPDITGANDDFSDPVFITSSVGCINPNSIVFMPQGVMFQGSNSNGIWILGRNLSTEYIGAGVEAYNSLKVKSAITVPGTTEVRFTLEDGSVLMYDYYYQQWGTFNGVPAISSTVFEAAHTYLNSDGQVRQQTPGMYKDGSRPVLVSFTTAWLKLTNLQGFQRAYFFYFLGNFVSPHKLNVQMAYDYAVGTQQSTIITPLNQAVYYGDDVNFGSGSPYGGTASVEQWRVFFQKQKCQSVQITVNEIYNAAPGIPPGAGFTMSGLNLVFGGKSSYPKLPSNQSAG